MDIEIMIDIIKFFKDDVIASIKSKFIKKILNDFISHIDNHLYNLKKSELFDIKDKINSYKTQLDDLNKYKVDNPNFYNDLKNKIEILSEQKELIINELNYFSVGDKNK